MEQSYSEDLDKNEEIIKQIEEIIKQIEERTKYKSPIDEDKYNKEYAEKEKIDDSTYQNSSVIPSDPSKHKTYGLEYEKFENIKGKYTNEQNKQFLIFLTKTAKPTIEDIIVKHRDEIEKLKKSTERDIPSRLQKLYTNITRNKNSTDKLIENKMGKINRHAHINSKLYTTMKVIDKLIKVYEEKEVKGGKYKTRRNINKKYKKSVKKYKNSYRRR